MSLQKLQLVLFQFSLKPDPGEFLVAVCPGRGQLLHRQPGRLPDHQQDWLHHQVGGGSRQAGQTQVRGRQVGITLPHTEGLKL